MIKVTVTLHLLDDDVDPPNAPVTEDMISEAIEGILDGEEWWTASESDEGDENMYTVDVVDVIVDMTAPVEV